MKYPHAYKIGPYKTPKIIKVLLLSIIIISLIAAITTPYTGFNYIGYFLGLSISGVKNFFFWQFFTYSLLQPGFGLNIGFITHLVFNMYILWVIGSDVIQKSTVKDFVLLYLSSIIITSFIALLTIWAFIPNYVFATTSVGVYSTLVAWMMLSPKDMRIFLFFTVPIKLKWIVTGLIGFNLFIDIANLHLINFFSYLTATLVGYFYSVMILTKHSPFKFLYRFERFLIFLFRPKIKRKK